MSPLFEELSKYSPKNILHIGGHIGEEGEVYNELGADVLFVEPVKEYADIIKDKGFNVLNVAIGLNRGMVDFRVAGIFSSTMKRNAYQDYEDNWLKENGTKVYNTKVKMVRLDDIEGHFDTLLVDTEGTVLDVLKSGKLNYKIIIAEESSDLEPQFENEPHNSEIEKYLNTKGYRKVYKFQNNAIYEAIPCTTPRRRSLVWS